MKYRLLSFTLLCSSLCFMSVSCSSAKPATTGPVVVRSEPDTAGDRATDSVHDASWRATPPPVGPAPDVVIPVFEQASLPNGLTVMVVHRATLPLVSVSLVLKSGSAVESASEQGLADLTYEMMLEGTADMDGVALAAAFADLGSRVSVGTAEDGAAFKALLLKKNLEAGLDLMMDILNRPAFKKDDFVRRQKERVSELQSLMGNPQYLSSIVASARVFGEGHPYAHPVMGTAESVAGFKLKQLRRFYRKHVSPENAALVLAGDITLDEATVLATEKFGAWKSRLGENSPVREKIKRESPPAFSVAMVAKPGMNQTIISAGTIGVPVGDNDEWALRIAIDAFSGMFGSRLNMNLREDKAYTYGAKGYLDAMFQDGAVMISTSVQGDVTGAALKEIMAEFDDLKTHPITEDEFHGAQENVLKSVSGWFESVSGLGSAAQTIFQRDLPLSRYSEMVNAYRKLTLEDVRKAADKYLNPSTVQVVLVGDPSQIKTQLSTASFGEPTLVSLD
jgi:zinc protease